MFQRPSPPDIETDLVIIGAGVAGINLGKSLLGSEIDFWILGSPFDSQLAKAGLLENTSLPEDTVGLDFIEKEFNSIIGDNFHSRSSLCTTIESDDNGYLVRTKFQNFRTKSIVIASGNKQKSLDFEGESEYFQKGISDCTVCDFPLYREKPVAVVGNHEYTVRAAKLMSQHTHEVALLWYKTPHSPNLEGVTSYSDVTNLVATGDGEVLTNIEFNHAGGHQSLEIRGLFVEGQPVPLIDYLAGLDLKYKDNFIATNEKYETNLPAIWAIGDVTGKSTSYEEAKHHGIEVAEFIIEYFTS